PNVQRDALLHGASLVDVAPTVLNLFGARADSLEGRCIEAISSPVPCDRGTTLGVATQSPPDPPTVHDDALSPAQRLALEHASRAWSANAAEAYLAAGRLADAASSFEAILARAPDDWRSRARLAQCHLHLGRYDECIEFASPLVRQRPDDPWGHLLCAAARVL